mmetsp:Transcript_33494/g.105833  ORF Transcript_33494/g.105833 Transcript_33494/m.105833 type:complete len:148 (-) Transcript_33494:827-1270(-)|eukprot:CAMPEP_0118854768 /NCGR_PEP_ID=MMETSP1163-20130328/2851_1 /TAXON_ID=124430 /ORGANISM="Phaeomonas parva, Strain CCMP2877" /LENGTH=147 /DNA_ID=CAMNT_0006787539 /DNA_START=111 /DNA_END=554 /DNA_ORIENTATION=-
MADTPQFQRDPEKQKCFNYLLYFNIGVQIFDILLHIAVNQPEALRIVSNIILMIYCGIAYTEKFDYPKGNSKTYPLAYVAINAVIYLVLNVLFLALEGLTRDRMFMFFLWFLTAIPLVWSVKVIKDADVVERRVNPLKDGAAATVDP